MSENEKDTLTKLELQIMQVIWRQGACTVSAVQAGLEQQLAYTTVQTMLNILQRKGKLRRTLRGRAFEYSATVTEARALGHAVRDLVDRMFGGSSEELVMSLIKSHQIDAKRGDVVGERTFGEGSVQKTIELPDGAALLLTVAKYQSPDGKKIEDDAVTPNVAVSTSTADEEEEGTPAKEDEPLNKALDLLKAKSA